MRTKNALLPVPSASLTPEKLAFTALKCITRSSEEAVHSLTYFIVAMVDGQPLLLSQESEARSAVTVFF